MNQTLDFITIDPETNQMHHNFKVFEYYASDKIKFMTKVEVNQDQRSDLKSQIKISKEPIYSKQDVIVFLLILQWFPNSAQIIPKARKGSFATEKQLKVRFQTNKIQNEDLIRIIYLLSEKIYIEDRRVDQFTKIVQNKVQISHKQRNCLTVILGGVNSRGKMANLASTIDQTKYQYYWYDSTSYSNILEEKYDKSSSRTKNQNYNNKIPIIHRNSSRMHEISPRSPRISLGSRDLISDETQKKSQLQFNIQKAKKLFSSVQYILTESEVCIEMIIYHLSDSSNISCCGFKIQTLEEIVDHWPKFCTYPKIYKLNREKTLRELIHQAKSNYNLMISLEFKEISQKNIENIYLIINQFNQNVIKQFVQTSKQYSNDPDYNEYLEKLENQIINLQAELLNNYGVTKKEYGSRILKNIEKKNYKNNVSNYTLMKVLGKHQISSLDIGFKRYKELIVDNYLESGFEEFKQRKKVKNRYYSRLSQNCEEEELNYVENRIQICDGKKTMLEKAIDLQMRENQSLKMMLKLFEKDQIKESLGSETFNL